jgi:APA family basic amino acid/polyamine antiporter
VTQPDQPARVLGLADTTAIVVGAIIGVGIFFTPHEIAAIVGTAPLALAAWAVAGAIVLCGALTFAELGGLHHASGAQYSILREAYGPMPAFLYVFCNATAIQAGSIGIIAWLCALNLGLAVRGAPPSSAGLVLLGAALIAVLVVANIQGTRLGARIQNATVIAKVLALLAVTVLAAVTPSAAVSVSASAPVAPASPARALLAALVPAFFTYGGWQQALWVAGEVRDPRRTIPRALVGGILVVIAVYLLANWAYLHLLGADGVAHSQALAADAVAVAWPSAGRRVVAGVVAVSAFGVLNAQLLGGPRLVYGMARDGRFFPVFGRLGQTGTPVFAILLIGAMAMALLAAAGMEGVGRLLNGVVFIDGVFFALTGAALFVLRQKRPDADRPMRVPGYPIVPIVFVAGELGVVAGAYLNPTLWAPAWIGIAWIAAGALLYAVRFREA